MSSASKGLRRAGMGGLSALLAATAMTGLASTANATTDATFTRVAGADRYATSAAVADLFGTVGRRPIRPPSPTAHPAPSSVRERAWNPCPSRPRRLQVRP